RRDTDMRLGKLPGRQPEYPLIDWGWWRADAIAYLREQTGVTVWPKSACTMCPYALDGPNRGDTVARLIAAPRLAMRPLLMEHTAVALNERQGLIAGRRLAWELRSHPGGPGLLAAFAAHLDEQEWAVWEVRRALLRRADGKTRAARSLTTIVRGGRQEMTAALERVSARLGIDVERDGPHRRVHVARRQAAPSVEHAFVLAPATAQEKTSKPFAKMWMTALAEVDTVDRQKEIRL
ncbi:hypothetical protein ACFQES_50285, partial [Nonomuraea salmonea]